EFIQELSIVRHHPSGGVQTVLKIKPATPYTTHWEPETGILTVNTILEDTDPPQPPAYKRSPTLLSARVSRSTAPKEAKLLSPVTTTAVVKATRQNKQKLAPRLLSYELKPTAHPGGDSQSTASEATRLEAPEHAVFSLTSWPEYTLARTGENQYELTLPGFQVEDKRLLLPRYAPVSIHSFRTIEVTATPEKNDPPEIRITLTLEPGIELTSRVIGTKLFLLPKNSSPG
ncbi:hypothetical protein MRY87_12200, partial [bacterium]|nr:hypothetical protein [bacterium]